MPLISAIPPKPKSACRKSSGPSRVLEASSPTLNSRASASETSPSDDARNIENTEISDATRRTHEIEQKLLNGHERSNGTSPLQPRSPTSDLCYDFDRDLPQSSNSRTPPSSPPRRSGSPVYSPSSSYSVPATSCSSRTPAMPVSPSTSARCAPAKSLSPRTPAKPASPGKMSPAKSARTFSPRSMAQSPMLCARNESHEPQRAQGSLVEVARSAASAAEAIVALVLQRVDPLPLLKWTVPTNKFLDVLTGGERALPILLALFIRFSFIYWGLFSVAMASAYVLAVLYTRIYYLTLLTCAAAVIRLFMWLTTPSDVAHRHRDNQRRSKQHLT